MIDAICLFVCLFACLLYNGSVCTVQPVYDLCIPGFVFTPLVCTSCFVVELTTADIVQHVLWNYCVAGFLCSLCPFLALLSTEITRQGTKSIVLYTVQLYCTYAGVANPVTWSVQRRFSEFVSFHLGVVEKVRLLSQLVRQLLCIGFTSVATPFVSPN